MRIRSETVLRLTLSKQSLITSVCAGNKTLEFDVVETNKFKKVSIGVTLPLKVIITGDIEIISVHLAGIKLGRAAQENIVKCYDNICEVNMFHVNPFVLHMLIGNTIDLKC